MAECGKLIETRTQEFTKLWNTGNLKEMRNYYHQEARKLPAGFEIVTGQDEAVKDVEGARDAGVAKIELASFDSELLASDACLAIGKWNWYKSDGELGGTEKFVTIWKLVDSQWVIYVDIFNTP